MSRICVYSGSSLGASPEYAAVAAAFGRACANRGIAIVYGGGSVGLMGALADSALSAGGEVIGVIPRATLALTKMDPLLLIKSNPPSENPFSFPSRNSLPQVVVSRMVGVESRIER